jgi:hypothetical protein
VFFWIDTHTWLADNLFLREKSQVIKDAKPYESAFLAGRMLPDMNYVGNKILLNI